MASLQTDGKTQSPLCANAFATLTPDNTAAKQGFDAVAQAVSASPELLSSVGRKMYIESASDAYSPRPSPSDSESDHDVTRPPDGPVFSWGGHFALCLCTHHGPANPIAGWVVGYGNRRVKDGGVDFRLDMSRPSPSTLAAWHARFFFNQDGMFSLGVFKDGRRITLSGNSFTSGACIFRDLGSTNIQFGEFGYNFQFTSVPETAKWRKDYEEYMGLINVNRPPHFVSPTPSPKDHILGQWCVSHTISSGSSGSVSTAKNLKTGSLLAVKRYRPKADRERFETEISMLEKFLPNHDRLVKYVDQLRENDSDGWVYLFMEPLAYCTLAEVEKFEEPQSISIVCQILQGIEALHAANIIHRDVKTANVGVSKMNPISIFLFDFDNAIKLSSSRKIAAQRGQIGTRYCLAPEMEEFRYDFKVDVWSCGIIAAQLIFCLSNKDRPWNDILAITHNPMISRSSISYRLPTSLLPETHTNQPRSTWVGGILLDSSRQYERVCKVLPRIVNAAETSIEHLIGQLLQCNPDRRPLAEEALSHPCFVASTSALANSPKPGQKRGMNSEDASSRTLAIPNQ